MTIWFPPRLWGIRSYRHDIARAGLSPSSVAMDDVAANRRPNSRRGAGATIPRRCCMEDARRSIFRRSIFKERKTEHFLCSNSNV